MIPNVGADIFGVMFRLIKTYAHNGSDIPPLQDEQIIRARQSLVLSSKFSEYCVLTLLSSIRHGTNAYQNNAPGSGSDLGNVTMSKCIEHMMQVDFLGIDPLIKQYIPMQRASIFESIVNSDIGVTFVKSINPLLSILYTDDIQSSAELNESHLFRDRYSVVVHLNEHHDLSVPLAYIDNIDLRTENIDVHHSMRGNK